MAGLFRTLRRSVGNSPVEDVVYVAIEGYTPKSDGPTDGMPFEKGDRFLLKSTANTNWWLVKRVDNGKTGYVPSNFVIKERDFADYEWVTFDCDRVRATDALMKSQFEPGSFLIRTKSKNFNADPLVLCLSIKERCARTDSLHIVHFEMKRQEGVYYLDNGRLHFNSLTDLVNQYAARRKSNIRLIFSVKKKEKVTPWEYHPDWIKQGNRLDKGHFGEVFLGKIFGKEEVALKTPRSERIEDEFKDFLKEAEIAASCDHPNVLVTYGVCSSRHFIIAEFMANGSLISFLNKNKLSSAECLSIAIKIASGMEYLANRTPSIVHRDLAARNVFVAENGKIIKVADFGMARTLEEDYYITEKDVFPKRWTAPEGFVFYDGIINTKPGKLTTASDVWSFAVTMFELFSGGEKPYEHCSDRDLYAMVTKPSVAENRLARPEKCPEAVYAVMLDCWKVEWRERPTFTELLASLSALVTESSTASTPSSSSVTARLSNCQTEEEEDEDMEVEQPLEQYNHPDDENDVPDEDEKMEEEAPVEEAARLERVPMFTAPAPPNITEGGEFARPTTFQLGL